MKKAVTQELQRKQIMHAVRKELRAMADEAMSAMRAKLLLVQAVSSWEEQASFVKNEAQAALVALGGGPEDDDESGVDDLQKLKMTKSERCDQANAAARRTIDTFIKLATTEAAAKDMTGGALVELTKGLGKRSAEWLKPAPEVATAKEALNELKNFCKTTKASIAKTLKEQAKQKTAKQELSSLSGLSNYAVAKGMLQKAAEAAFDNINLEWSLESDLLGSSSPMAVTLPSERWSVVGDDLRGLSFVWPAPFDRKLDRSDCTLSFKIRIGFVVRPLWHALPLRMSSPCS